MIFLRRCTLKTNNEGSVNINEGADGDRYFVFVRDAVATDNSSAQAGQIRDVVLSAPVG